MLTIFFSALVFGFVFCLSPGAVLAETLRRGLLHGFRPALLVQVGSLVGDAVWAVIGLTGIALLMQHDAVRVPLTAVCALYLAWLGARSLLDAWRLPAADNAPAGSGQNALAVGAAISLANPKNIVYWGALGSALSGIVGATPSHGQTLMFFAGFMLASVLSCFLTAALVNLLRQNASPVWQRVSYAACGLVLIYLAILAARGL
ncbi:LysE family transporter [Pseudomonas lurida]|jgi:chemosensory pili system protein ChpE|uniref:LysE family transporter n=1 Tax=Pseudomonas quebecensis TaxID=2995174 RepID=A0ABY6QMD2_9PSED|nr:MULTISPECIES: LysE family transporter [Pseudomonas]MBA1293186.1 LysE family transporter [Pseudomonas lurida]MCP1511251.1 chemosensory pili system protein ChpE [Pseudomonas rhodesiae]MCX4067509.1 LysE family transporter [Pseudomonas quebecensis]MDF9770071.1 chemosensory pili system protein ChpE [Pseudomonas rhodesiae]UZW20911.1 LysE family transporter [Pseudomonas quebecensis]